MERYAQEDASEMAVAVKAHSVVRAAGAVLTRTTKREVALAAGEREWTFAIPRFSDYRQDARRPALSARLTVLPAVEEDGLYAHAAWVGSRDPPSGRPRTNRKGAVYMDRYMVVDSMHGDGTWISLKASRPLNTGRVRVADAGHGRITALSVPAVIVDAVILREEHFTRYSFSPGLMSAYALSVSEESYKRTLTLWGDSQAGSSIQVPRSRQGNYTLSAVVKYAEGSDDQHRSRVTSVSITVNQ